MGTRALIILSCCFVGITANAQIRIPPFDIELKLHQSFFPGPGEEDGLEVFEATNLQGGLHWQISQHLALGGFYSRSIAATAKYKGAWGSTQTKNEYQQLVKGIDVRLSTGRAKKWRSFIALNYSQIEIIEDNENYRLAAQTGSFGASLGIMLKLSNKLYLNLIELNGQAVIDPPFWFNTDTDSNEIRTLVGAKMGLLYNIDFRK